MKLKHPNLAEGVVNQDASDVKTKFSKPFRIGTPARDKPRAGRWRDS